MNARDTRKKRLLLGIIFLVLLLPAVQTFFPFFSEKQLDGTFIPNPHTPLSTQSYFDGSFQKDFEPELNDQLGFHRSLVRFRNQCWLWMLGETALPGSVVGKEGYLYEEPYILAATGKDFIGRKAIGTMTAKLKALQDTLAAHHVTLLIVFAPGKASVYPEFIPDRYGAPVKENNHFVMRAAFDSAGINLIDFNSYFTEQRKALPYPVYPKTGTHWSDMAALHAMDSIAHYIGIKKNVHMPSVIYAGEEWSGIPRHSDDDLGSSLNLFFPFKNYRMAYPKFEIDNGPGKAKLSVLTVADSYFQLLRDAGWETKVCAQHQDWYYNQTVRYTDGRPDKNVLDMDIRETVLQQDVVMILAGEMNYGKLSWGFIDDAYQVLVRHQPLAGKRLREIENEIRRDSNWLNMVKEKASRMNIPLDTMIRRDALFILRGENQEK